MWLSSCYLVMLCPEGLSWKSGYPSTPISGPSSPSISVAWLTRIGVIRLLILNHTYAITKPNTASTTTSMACMMNCEKSPKSSPRTPSDPYAFTNPSRTTPFHPAPYSPVAKIPTDSTPQRPLVPCTEIAPTGSSMPRLSKKKTDITTRKPATAPIIAAPMGLTKAQGAVIATRPASIPLQHIVVSGLRPFSMSVTMADTDPIQPASMVFTTMKLMRKSVPASVEPGLKPNQPKARIKVPRTTMGTLCPGMASGLPCESYFPIRAPRTMAPANPMTPPIPCTTPEPAKSTAPCPRPQLTPPWASQPPPQTQLA